MATSGFGIWASLGNKSVRDYTHAAQIFRTNNYARAPKSKFQFYVRLNINPAASSDQFTSAPDPTDPNEMSYLVRNVEMPKFELDVQDLNQYNKKVVVQRGIRYSPVTIKFFDDNIGSLRHFWQSYYNYYYADGSYTDLDYDPANDDKYSARNLSRWGLDTGSREPYLANIQIYSLYGGEAQLITLQNPILSNFSHDQHDYTDVQGSVEPTMTIHYTGVTYDEGIDASYGIPGFGQTSPGTYDTEYSALNPNGLQINLTTGIAYKPNGTQSVTTKKTYNKNNNLNLQTSIYNTNSSNAVGTISNAQINSILQQNGNLPKGLGYQFPTATVANSIANDINYGAVDNSYNTATSDGETLSSPQQLNTLYPSNTWQSNLFQKGYTSNQISAASDYINSVNPPAGTNIQFIAEDLINNSSGSYFTKDTSVSLSAQTQPTYNGDTWQSKLESQGYSPSQISSAEQFFSQINTSPNVDLTKSAATYINSQSNKGPVTTS